MGAEQQIGASTFRRPTGPWSWTDPPRPFEFLCDAHSRSFDILHILVAPHAGPREELAPSPAGCDPMQSSCLPSCCQGRREPAVPARTYPRCASVAEDLEQLFAHVFHARCPM